MTLGIVAAQGNNGVAELLAIAAADRDERLPMDARASVGRRGMKWYNIT
jgi:hypothetical protein